MSDIWGADVPVSKPSVLPTDRASVDLGGFAFTTGGITSSLSEVDVEEIFSPMFAPEGWREGR